MPVRRRVGRPRVGGRRRVVRRRVMGRGLWDTIKSGFNAAKDYVKQNRLISQGIRLIPGKYSEPLSEAVHAFGYGRRKVHVMRKRPMMRIPRMRIPRMRVVRARMPRNPGNRSKLHVMSNRRVGGRIIFPSVYTTGLGGLSATTY